MHSVSGRTAQTTETVSLQHEPVCTPPWTKTSRLADTRQTVAPAYPSTRSWEIGKWKSFSAFLWVIRSISS